LRAVRVDDYYPNRVIFTHRTDQQLYRRRFEYSLSLEGSIKILNSGTVLYREGPGVYRLDAGVMIPN
jgi:hypothetical protein